jgi:hypothetical protein
MMGSMRKFVSKTMALALLATAGLLAYALVVEPLVSRFSDIREQIAEQRQLLGRLTTAASREGQAREFDSLAKARTGGAIFLTGNSDAVRIAELQSLVGTITEAEGVAIKSTRAVPARERDGLRLLGVEAQMSANIEQLQRILHNLETGRPYLIVDTLQITPPALLSDDNPSAGTTLEVRLGLLGIAANRKG